GPRALHADPLHRAHPGDRRLGPAVLRPRRARRAVDRRRRARHGARPAAALALAPRDGDRRRRVLHLVDHQARDRPPAARRGEPPPSHADPHRPLVPLLARDLVVRGRPRVLAARAAGAALRRRVRHGPLAPVPRRALPVGHRGGRGAGHRPREPRAM
ncbi:MAG: hypothetical protein AVDCRST_MAG30-1244, partial [uncultured Solirubrobacteraceae bacterium]